MYDNSNAPTSILTINPTQPTTEAEPDPEPTPETEPDDEDDEDYNYDDDKVEEVEPPEEDIPDPILI